ncbi:MAG: polyprenyl synthetase family protein [Bacteroidales bacterium]|nr:polyprenyl synthetase family protein [Bacteroidales bacterium]
MDILAKIQNPILKELKEQNLLLRDSLKSQIPLINSVVHYFLENKGKMIRPIMLLLASKLCSNGNVTKNSMHSAVALELLHNASLIHDDVVDEAKQRRGHSSVNAVWDNKVAVLMGDFFLARCLEQSTLTKSLEIQQVLAKLSSSLAEGELEQLANARGCVINEDSYFSVIKNKTASLFIACMKLGAISVNASQSVVDRLALFGEKLGIIFQIRDDIFDYFDDTTIGKPTGNDIREGKITLPLLFALKNGSGVEHQNMMSLLNKDILSKEDISSLVNYAKANGGIEYAQATMLRYAYEAKTILDMFEDSPSKQAFIILVDYIIDRDK